MPRRPSSALWALAAVLATGAGAQDTPLLVRNGRVHARPGAPVVVASVLVEGGKIKAVGKDLAAPEGARVLEAEGLDVYASFIDPLNDGLLEVSPAPAGYLGGGDRALDVYDRFAAARRAELLRAGVGVVGLGVAVNGMRSGVAAVLATVGEEDGGPLVLGADRFVQFDPTRGGGGGPPAGGGGGRGRRLDLPTGPVGAVVGLPGREGALKNVEEALDGAKKYREAWEKYEKDLEEYKKKLADGGGAATDSKPAEKKDDEKKPESSGPQPLPDGFRNWPRDKQREWMRENMRRSGMRPGGGGDDPKPAADAPSKKLKPPEKPKVEPEKEALVRVLKRETPLWVGAEWRQDIGWALDMATKRDVKIALLGAAEAGEMLDRLKAARALVVLPPPVAFSEEPLGGAPEDLSRTLAKAGIPFTFVTAGRADFGSAGLPAIAALAIGRGLSEDDALAATTVHAARALGMEKTLGTVEAGKDAHLMLVKGSPFAPGAKAEKLVVRGRVVAPEN